MKYHITYKDKSGDTSKVWVEADSAAEAESVAEREYWDIDEIISVRKA